MSFFPALGAGAGAGAGVDDGVIVGNGVSISNGVIVGNGVSIGNGVIVGSGFSVGNGVAPHLPTAPSTTLVDTATFKITGSVTVIASVDPTHNFNVNDDRPNLGTIIGIVIGIVVAMLVLIGGILFLFKRRRQRRRGLLNVQSSDNRDESSSSSLEGIIQSAVFSTSEITNNVTITRRTPKSNLISDTSHRLALVPGVPRLLTTGDSSSEFESVADTGRGVTVADSDGAAQTPVSVFTAPASPLNLNSRNYNATLPHRDLERCHTDSGIRMGTGTLLVYEYDDGANSEWSVRSKDRFPPATQCARVSWVGLKLRAQVTVSFRPYLVFGHFDDPERWTLSKTPFKSQNQ